MTTSHTSYSPVFLPKYNSINENKTKKEFKEELEYYERIHKIMLFCMETFQERLERYLNYFTVSNTKLKSLTNYFQDELEIGLNLFATNKHGWDVSVCSFKMLDSCIVNLPTGKESGVYYALDFGGTNFRAVRASLDGKGHISSSQYKLSLCDATVTSELKRGLMDPKATASDMFDFFAECCKTLMEKENDLDTSRFHVSEEIFMNDNQVIETGHIDLESDLKKTSFTFSFPCSQRSINSAVLLEWTKGFQTGRQTNDPVEGLDIVQLMDAAFRRKCVPAQITAVINDTVGTLISCCYEMDYSLHPPCLIGLILGTGVNACYYEEDASNYNYIGNVINIECGNFNRNLPTNNVDDELDFAEVSSRGAQRLEKMISGAYLGELSRRAIVKVLQAMAPESAWEPYSFTSEYISIIIDDKSDLLNQTKTLFQNIWKIDFPPDILKSIQELLTKIVKRAASLASIIICGTARKTGHLQPAIGGLSVAVDGSLYKCVPAFRKYIREAIDNILGHETAQLIHLITADDGSGKGSAVLAATLS